VKRNDSTLRCFLQLNEQTLPKLDKLARNFELAANDHVAEPNVSAFYHRLGRVYHGFEESLAKILASATPELRARLAQMK
jgi:hypothetical protein